MSRRRNFWSRQSPPVQAAIIAGVVALITAVIAACGGIVVAVIGWDRVWEIVLGPTTPKPTTATVAVHVADKDDGTSIPRARVLFFFKGERLIGDTDTTGTSQFQIPLSGEAVNASVVVEANNYKVERFDGIKLQDDNRVDVHLSKQEGDKANVIILVSDENEEPLSGVNVVLLVEGNPYTQLTDSNGIAQIPLIFPTNQIGGEIQLSAPDFDTNRQNVTLLPNTIVPIRLNRKTNAFDIAELLPTPSPPTYVTTTLTPVVEIVTFTPEPVLSSASGPQPSWTSTPTPLPTWTPTFTPVPPPTWTSTPTPLPTWTPLPTSTNIPTPTPTSSSGNAVEIQSVWANKCLDVPGGATADGTLIQIYGCHGGPVQQWVWGENGEIRSVSANKCLDVPGGATADGTLIQIYECHGGPVQQWVWGENGEIRSVWANKCLDVPGGATADGTLIQIYECHGGPVQQWRIN